MNILQTIVAQKQLEVAALPPWTPGGDLLQLHGPRRPFYNALATQRPHDVTLIAEVKKASPSKGVICPDFDPVRIARAYEAAGATCLSILTDEHFFQGSLSYLASIRNAVSLPLLRKDFIIDDRQIPQSVAAGADAILLIVAILDDPRLSRFLQLAHQAGLAALVEVHDDAEFDRAIAAGARLIGVNNRDLRTFKVDLQTTARVARHLRDRHPAAGPDVLLVGESGIHSRADVCILRDAGARAILVGESIVNEPAAGVARLLNDAS